MRNNSSMIEGAGLKRELRLIRAAPTAFFAFLLTGMAFVFPLGLALDWWTLKWEPTPHATVSFYEVRADNTGVHFRLQGHKLDAAAPPIITAAWLYSDTTLIPAPVMASNGEPQRDLPARVPGERYISMEYIVPIIPTVSLTDPGTRFRVCLVYATPPELVCTDVLFGNISAQVPSRLSP